MKLSKTLGLATTGLAALFAASSAHALDFHPSPDGKFQQCVSKEAFPATLTELNQGGIAGWDAHEGKQKTIHVHEMLTADTIHPNEEKTWIGWTRKDFNDGKSDYCVNATGTGIITFNNLIPEALPSRPFGVSYVKPKIADMGNGNVFLDNDSAAKIKFGFNPVVILHTGNNTFGTVYANAAGKVIITDTRANGATVDTTDASDFKFAPSLQERYTQQARSFGTALAYQNAQLPAPSRP